jgi:hypothetical protein
MSERNDTTRAWNVRLKPSGFSASPCRDGRRHAWAVVPADSGGVGGIAYCAETEADRLSRKREKVGFKERNGKTYGNEQDNLTGSIVQRLWIVLIFLVMTVSSQLVEGGEPASPHPIVDSGVWASTNWSGDVYWLDNERVLFLGSEHGKLVAQEHQALLVWDTTKHSITMLKQNISWLCYRNGVVLLSQKIDNPAGGPWKYRFFRGPLGREQPYEQDSKDLPDRLNCRAVKTNAGHERGHSGRYLIEGHGYLDLGDKHASPRMNPPVMFFRQADSEGVTLPFGVRQVENIEYYNFKKAYFLYGWFFDEKTGGVTTLWPKNLPHPVWWLTPEGSTTEVLIPSGPWNAGGGVLFTPSQRGVLVTYQGGVKSNRDAGTQGVYLVQQNGVTKELIGGFVHRPGLSPDGCKIAFSHAPNAEADRPNDKNRRTLKMIDLCSQGAQP